MTVVNGLLVFSIHWYQNFKAGLVVTSVVSQKSAAAKMTANSMAFVSVLAMRAIMSVDTRLTGIRKHTVHLLATLAFVEHDRYRTWESSLAHLLKLEFVFNPFLVTHNCLTWYISLISDFGLQEGALFNVSPNRFWHSFCKHREDNSVTSYKIVDVWLSQGFLNCTFQCDLKGRALEGFDVWAITEGSNHRHYFGVRLESVTRPASLMRQTTASSTRAELVAACLLTVFSSQDDARDRACRLFGAGCSSHRSPSSRLSDVSSWTNIATGKATSFNTASTDWGATGKFPTGAMVRNAAEIWWLSRSMRLWLLKIVTASPHLCILNSVILTSANRIKQGENYRDGEGRESMESLSQRRRSSCMILGQYNYLYYKE